MNQRDRKRTIDIGDRMGQVTTVASWLRNGHFANADEARGAFKLAHQQGLDGMGPSIQEWMGLSDSEFDAWMRFGAIRDIAGK
jgi:hypothetical protein